MPGKAYSIPELAIRALASDKHTTRNDSHGSSVGDLTRRLRGIAVTLTTFLADTRGTLYASWTGSVCNTEGLFRNTAKHSFWMAHFAPARLAAFCKVTRLVILIIFYCESLFNRSSSSLMHTVTATPPVPPKQHRQFQTKYGSQRLFMSQRQRTGSQVIPRNRKTRD